MKENNTYHDGMEGLNLPESLRVTPFNTPEGYFEELSSNLVTRIGLEGKIPSEEIPFSVPSDYFSQLTDQITSQVAIAKQTDNIDSWKTPTGYFENLTENIQKRIKVESIASQEEDFTVPMGYFEGLHDRLQTRIFEENLTTTTPTDGFSVPDQYFAKLKDELTAKIKTADSVAPEKTTVVRKLNVQQWIQYAAAACVATVLGTASYNAVIEHNTVSATESHLAAVPEEEIINYLASSNTSDDMLYLVEYMNEPVEDKSGVCSKVEDDDIEDYLNYML